MAVQCNSNAANSEFKLWGALQFLESEVVAGFHYRTGRLSRLRIVRIGAVSVFRSLLPVGAGIDLGISPVVDN